METVILQEGALVWRQQRVEASAREGGRQEQVRAWGRALASMSPKPIGPVAAWLPDAWVKARPLDIPKGSSPKEDSVLTAYGLWKQQATKGAFWLKQACEHHYEGLTASLDPDLAQMLVKAFEQAGWDLVWLGPVSLKALGLEPWRQENQGNLLTLEAEPTTPTHSLPYAMLLAALALLGLGLGWGNLQASRQLAHEHERLIQGYSLLARIQALEAQQANLESRYHAWQAAHSAIGALPQCLQALDTAKASFPNLWIQSLKWSLDTRACAFCAHLWAPQVPEASLRTDAQAFIQTLGTLWGTPLQADLQLEPDGRLRLEASGTWNSGNQAGEAPFS